jgi:predicted Zn-dependent protease
VKGLGKLICRDRDKDCMRRIALYGGLAGGVRGPQLQKSGFMANFRVEEMEADRMGYKSAARRLSPQYVERWYEKLIEMDGQNKRGQSKLLAPFADALSTHPPRKERIAQQRQLVKEFGATSESIASP